MVSKGLKAAPLGRLRLASVDDAPTIFSLVTESMAKNFRVNDVTDIVYLFETCLLSICYLDSNEAVVGCVVLKDYPLIPAVYPGAWEDFVHTKYKTIELNSRNSVFIHLLCWNSSYGRELVDGMLKSIFMHDHYLQFIVMMKCIIGSSLLMPGQTRSEGSFKRTQAIERGCSGDQLPALWIMERKEVCPKLKIRRAVEEDNDDIIPIIERHSKLLRELYGDFYVSELISRHPESERVLLVCEHRELAVGVMILNTQINYEALEESFELSPFAGLRHLDKPPRRREYGSTTSLIVGGGNMLESLQELNIDFPGPRDPKSRVTWIYEDDAFKDIRKEMETPKLNQVDNYSQLDSLQFLEEDEDEFEYDIVNIDTDLLRLPRLFTSDDIMKFKGFSDESLPRRQESGFDNKYILKEKSKPIASSPHMSSISSCKAPEPIQYSGRPNAFLLEVFAMHANYDERYGFEMLEAAYELFPDRDYCIMCLPSWHTCFPLLEHFTLVTPYGFRMRFINDSLYVAHVNAIRGRISVRPAEAYDIPNLEEVLEHATRKQDLMELFKNSLDSLTLSSYVLLNENQPIGLVVLGPLEDGTSIRTQYDLETEARRAGTDASILACVMSPIMEPHARWYLRDVLRHTKYCTLFWVCRLFAKGDASPVRNLMSLASYMKPVRPRRAAPNMIGNNHLEKVFKDIATPFALWMLERPLTSMPKVHVNNSIVVVGASRTGLAFLETLLLGPTSEYLTFTNITLVSQYGLPTVPDFMRAAETCVPRDGRYTDRYIKSMPFYYYVDVMSAVMVQIDRKKKCIHLKGGGVKFYDELILTCGLQFQHPEYLKDSIELAKEMEKGKPCIRTLMDNPGYLPDSVPLQPTLPYNVMLINSLYQANTCLRKLMRMISETKNSSDCLCNEKPVVVYGDCIEAYSCMAALLELGVSGNKIAFVEPFPPEDATAMRVNCFNNETVDGRVQQKLDKLGIRTYRQCHFNGWFERDGIVEYLRLMSPLHVMHVPCFALFYYGIKAIDLYAFKAINESGLVYDGGVVVGPLFETNDPHVFAAGPCVRYSRRLYAPHDLHKYYHSEDVGEALAKLFLKKVDPFMTQRTNLEEPELMQRYSSSLLAFRESRASVVSSRRLSNIAMKSRWQPVMKFESPIVQSATLPGPLYYMVLRKPGRDTPMAVKLLLPQQGHTLITDKRDNYFRLQINALHCVESITCLSKKQFCPVTLTQLYGKHEAYFNNLLARFNMNLIDDLFEYFTNTWIAAFYQEPFVNLLNDIYEHGGNTVLDVVKTKYKEFYGRKQDESMTGEMSALQFKESTCKECGQNEVLRHDADTFWRAVGGERIVFKNLTKYLQKNSVANPHYAVPDFQYI
ncbi:cilia- and flagella-associated protein 61-like [Maniola jurtina]|uniref:cilia- and flagella-associated protein 61-like n=1 Tax=Maniola jurtina TaxID=191418 RepID=UPI001E689903|nr:cilia- and flagella-associated protein 61-like [Maniola jurtina]